MRTKSQIAQDNLLRSTIWISIALTLTFIYFANNPISWSNDNKQTRGTTITLDTKTDFLLVVDYEKFTPNPKNFQELNFSLAWLNTLQQEVGPTALADAAKFQDMNINNFRFVILSHSASQNDAWLPKLRSFLDQGGILILEMPTGDIRKTFSADGKGGLRVPQNFTYAAGLSTELNQKLATIDLSTLTTIIGSAGPLDDSETFLTIDGVPVAYKKKYSAGYVITLDFNYGMLITSLQQGKPNDDFTLRKQNPSDPPKTSDLAIKNTELYALPVADLIERFIIYGIIDTTKPIIAFWPFIDLMDGALILAHNENGMGPEASWIAQYENTFKASSTYLITFPTTFKSENFLELQNLQAEIAIRWIPNNIEKLSTKPYGPFSFSPFVQNLNLSEQIEYYKTIDKDLPTLLSAQSYQFIWSPTYAQNFRILAANQIRIDLSYAPDTQNPGYAFGTAFPFMPIDENALIFNILEFPITFPSIKTETELQNIENALKQSQLVFHQPITATFEPDLFKRSPSVEAYFAWKNTYKIAADANHWITSAKNFYRFSRARHNAEIQTTQATLNINNKKIYTLRLETLAPETGMALSVPQSINDKVFIEARRGLNRVKSDTLLAEQLKSKPISIFGYQRILLPLSKGFNAIDILYE